MEKNQKKAKADNLETDREKLINGLKSISKDEKEAERLVNKLLSVDRQLNVEDTDVFVRHDKTAKVINRGAFSYTKTDGTIVFSQNGLKTIIYSNSQAYNNVNYLFDLKDIIDNKTYGNYGLKKKAVDGQYEDVFFITSSLLQLPILSLQSTILGGAIIEVVMNYVKVLSDYSGDTPTAGDEEKAFSDMSEFNSLIEKIKGEMEIEVNKNEKK